MGGLAGWWVIIPLAMMICMFLMMSRMFSSRRGGSGMGPMCMGPMGDMDGHGDENRTGDDGAMDVLRRRYASGEITDGEFDAKRRRLEGR